MAASRLVRDSFLSLAAVAAAGLTRVIFAVGVARVFSKITFGHANTLIALATFVTLCVSPGLGQAVAKEVALRAADEDGTERSHILNWGSWVHHITLSVLAVLSFVVIPLFMPLTWRGLGQVSLLVIGYGLYTYYKAVYYGANRVKQYIALELGADALFVVVLIAVIVINDPRWATLPMIVLYLAFAVAAFIRMPLRFGVGIPTSTRNTMLLFAFVTSLGAAASTGSMYLAQVAATRIGGRTADAGLFAAAVTLVSPAYLIPRALSTVLFPAMTEAVGRGDTGAVRWQFWKATSLLAGAILPGFVLVGVASQFFAKLVMGTSYGDSALMVSLMVWATWVYVAAVPSVNVLIAQREHGIYLIPTAAAVVSTIIQVGYWWLIADNVVDVTIGYLVGAVVQCAIPMVLVVLRLGRPGPIAWLRWIAAIGVAVLATWYVDGVSAYTSLGAGIAAAAVATVLVFPDLKLMYQTFMTNRGKVEETEALV